jgi:hypothetical protein
MNMKNVVTVFALVLVTAIASAATSPAEDKICKDLSFKAWDACVDYACAPDIANGTFKNVEECSSASDFAEYAQGYCDSYDKAQVGYYVELYNKSHSKAPVTCSDY